MNNKHLPLGHYVMITSFYLCEAPQGSAEFAVLSSRRKLRHFSRKLRDSHLERQIPKGKSPNSISAHYTAAAAVVDKVYASAKLLAVHTHLEFRKALWCRHNAQAYPDALAQCVYTAFIHAFPASWSSFDDSFKSSLVEIIYLWQTGI